MCSQSYPMLSGQPLPLGRITLAALAPNIYFNHKRNVNKLPRTSESHTQ